MDKNLHDAPLCQAFECLRFDSSAATPEMFPVAAHSHYFSEIIFVRSGVCRVTRKGYTHLLSAGELIYIAPMIRHSIESADGKPVQVDLIKFSATRLREIPSYLEGLRALSADAAQVRLPIQVTAEEARFYHMDSIIEECIAESVRRDFAWDLHIRALIYLLITALARFWISCCETLMDQMPQERSPILDVPSYVEEHISEALRVEDLAARCGMSYHWFAKCFHEFFGISCGNGGAVPHLFRTGPVLHQPAHRLYGQQPHGQGLPPHHGNDPRPVPFHDEKYRTCGLFTRFRPNRTQSSLKVLTRKGKADKMVFVRKSSRA